MTGVLSCWSSPQPGKICGGKLEWTKTARGWSAKCPKCRTERRAASGEELELERSKPCDA